MKPARAFAPARVLRWLEQSTERNVTVVLLSLQGPVSTRLAVIWSAVVAIWNTVEALIVSLYTRRLRKKNVILGRGLVVPTRWMMDRLIFDT